MFDAFGSGTGTSGNPNVSGDPFAGFGGQAGYYADSETGLLLLGHRYYDPGTGRFINRDPIGYGGGLNLYAYCQNNPIMGLDPSGFCQGEGSGNLWYDRVYRSVDGFRLKLGPLGLLPGFSDAERSVDMARGMLQLPAHIGHLGEASATQGARGVFKDSLTALAVVGLATGAARAGGAGGEAADDAYLILSGVHRAKGAQDAGYETIAAQVSDGGKLGPVTQIPLKDLRVTSDKLDLTVTYGRYRNSLSLAQQGPLPDAHAIEVVRTAGGHTLAEIVTDPLAGFR